VCADRVIASSRESRIPDHRGELESLRAGVSPGDVLRDLRMRRGVRPRACEALVLAKHGNSGWNRAARGEQSVRVRTSGILHLTVWGSVNRSRGSRSSIHDAGARP
jgi:hypothetical protein